MEPRDNNWQTWFPYGSVWSYYSAIVILTNKGGEGGALIDLAKAIAKTIGR